MSRQGPSRSTPMITLYDSPGTRAQTWVPNIWRIRFILNYKRLRYNTVWIEFPDVEATLRGIGAPPSAKTRGRKADLHPPPPPQILSNTNNIAEYLEACYPARPVFPEGSRALQTLFVHYIQEVFAKPLLPIMVPLTHDRLPERTQSHFHGNLARDDAHARLRAPPPTRPAASSLTSSRSSWTRNVGDGASDGIVAQGCNVSYADFALCSMLLWIEQMAPHDGWSRIRDWNGGRWVKLRHRCKDLWMLFDYDATELDEVAHFFTYS
ncbi:hypothetical protein DFH09DRAFT_1488587 [Mycena vulgaris]|nr:hypothetical protein DFH09DRAFT_1488587 [Mycena vulgaris]